MFDADGVSGTRRRWRGVVMALLLAVGPGVAVHAAAIEGEALHLRLAPALSGNGAGDTPAARQQAMLPVLLGISSLRNRIEHARLETETWRQANQALGAHLMTRERHLSDLQHLVAVQDDTIEAMQQQVQAFVDLDHLASTVPATLKAPATTLTAPAQRSLRGDMLWRIPYAESATLLVIVALLAWALYLRAQMRSAERGLAGATMDPAGAASARGGGRQPVSRTAAASADVVSVFCDYERSAGALLGAFGGTADRATDRDTLLRGLAAVPDREAFLVEALAVARARGDESQARRIAGIIEESGFAPAPDAARTGSHPPGTESSTGAEHSSVDFDLVFSTDDASDVSPASARDTVVMEPEAPAGGPGVSSAPPVPESGPKVSADPDALKEIDTLIAFENYDQASSLLEKLLREAPANPEYRLRLLHILSAAGETEASAEQEEILAQMMDAPLSETLARVRNIGRDLLPGHRLFNAEGQDSAGESGFERDPLFDVTAGPVQVSTDPDPTGKDATGVDEDVGDFMKGAFDTDAGPDGSGLAPSLEPMDPEMSRRAESGDAAPAGGESSDAESEFSATVFDLPEGHVAHGSDDREP